MNKKLGSQIRNVLTFWMMIALTVPLVGGLPGHAQVDSDQQLYERDTYGGLSLSGSQVIDYDKLFPGRYYEYDLSESEFAVIQGTKLPSLDGCSFQVEHPVTEDGRPTAIVERQYDQETCEMLVEIGTPSEADVERAAPGGGSPLSQDALLASGYYDSSGRSGHEAWQRHALDHIVQAVDTELPELQQHPQSANLPQYVGHTTSLYDEPLRWAPCGFPMDAPRPPEEEESPFCTTMKELVKPVVRVATYVQWEPSSTCASAGRSVHWSVPDEVHLTNWERDIDVFDFGASCERTWSKHHMRWVNRTFCATLIPVLEEVGISPLPPLAVGDPTIIHIWPNKFWGLPVSDPSDPDFHADSNPSKEGGCSEWLRYSSVGRVTRLK